MATTAAQRSNGRKRTYRWVLESLSTFRYAVLNLPAELARPEGRADLRIAASKDTQAIAEVISLLNELNQAWRSITD